MLRSRRSNSALEKPIRLALLLLLTSTASQVQGQSPTVVETLPPSPVLLPAIHGMELHNNAYEYTDPYLPLMTNTRDHRLGVSRKVYVNQGVKEVRFFLLKPEALEQGGEPVELAMAAPGAGHWIHTFDGQANNPSYAFDIDDFHDYGSQSGEDDPFNYMHFAICDSTLGYANGLNPYVCGAGDTKDCYEFDLMLGLSIDADQGNGTTRKEAQLFSRRVRVTVANPKTSGAVIESVEALGAITRGVRFQGNTAAGIDSLHTPMIVGEENRLLVARIGGQSVPIYTDENGTHPFTSGPHDMVYAVNTTTDQCNVAEWKELRPISFAAVDPDILNLTNIDGEDIEIGFTQQAFRTPSGHTINPHEPILGNYLWVDQEANNLFFGTLKRDMIVSQMDVANGDPPRPLYDYTCVTGTQCAERGGSHQGWMMAGAWTDGKMVLLDSRINAMDFTFYASEDNHAMVNLYSDKSIRVGAAQEATLIPGGTEPAGWARTNVQFGSAQHLLNMAASMKPRRARDVVWTLTGGSHTEEFAFDDLISHRTFIVSPMNALKEMSPGVSGIYFDGVQPQVTGGQRPMRLQNAATSTAYDVPDFGEVIAAPGEGRIEHVALGGIQGRGFYLYPQSTIRYTVDTAWTGKPWMVSVFLDRRGTQSGLAQLFTFPGQASIVLQSNTHVRLCDGGSCDEVLLPKPLPTKGWSHLAFVRRHDAPKVQIFQDGFLFAEVDHQAGMDFPNTGFGAGTGAFEVGAAQGEAGFEGWIDEVKVIEGPFSLEEVCNHARGTLVAMPVHHQGTHKPVALLQAPFHDQTPMPSHWISGRQAVQDALHDTNAFAWTMSDYFACNIDYSTIHGVSVNDTGDSEVRSLRRRLLFPEGPVVHNLQRPVSVANEFCLSCHGANRPVGLGLDALTANVDPTIHNAMDDPRRMPLQPPRDLLGVVPQDYFGPGRPATTTGALAPLVSDRWILDGPVYRWKFDSAAGSILHNWVSGDPGETQEGEAVSNFGTFRQPGAGRGHSVVFDNPDSRPPIDPNLHGYLRVDANPQGDEPSIGGAELSLASWVHLDYTGQTISPETYCRAFTQDNDFEPCTIIAKSGANIHDITWGLRIFHKEGDWWVQMHVTTTDGVGHTNDAIGNWAMVLDDFAPGNWHHVAAVYDNGTIQLFLDGDPIHLTPEVVHTGQTAISEDPAEPVTLGTKLANGAPRNLFHGHLDEVHVFDRALAPWEVEKLAMETP